MVPPLSRGAHKACAEKGGGKSRPRRWSAGRACIDMNLNADLTITAQSAKKQAEDRIFMPTGISALQLVLTADPALIAIVRLSLIVSLSATLLAALIGVPFSAFLALVRFPGREAVIVVLNALMGLPRSWWGFWSTFSCRARARSDLGASCSHRRR